VLVADRNQKRRLDEEDLVVSACYAGQGPSQSASGPPHGPAYRVIRRTAHITVQVAERSSRNDGSESPPHRLPPRVHQDLASRWYAEKEYANLLHEDSLSRRT